MTDAEYWTLIFTVQCVWLTCCTGADYDCMATWVFRGRRITYPHRTPDEYIWDRVTQTWERQAA